MTDKKSIALPIECKRLIFLNALFQGGRLFVGAICVLYFLSFELHAGDYAWIKTTQAVIFIGLDIPLGYTLNKIGEYKSLLLALAFGIIGALGYLVFTSFWGFLLSETFLALSLSTWPVALSAYSMKILENYKIEGLVEKFFHCGDAISNVFVVVCGSLGGILYAYNKYIPYGSFLLFYLLAVLFSLVYLKKFEVKKNRNEKVDFFISDFKEMKSILPFASVLFLAQFFMQPLFHYWQLLFSAKFELSSQDISLVFIGYSLVMSVISWGYSRITHFSTLRSNLFVIIAACLGSLVYAFIARLEQFASSLMLFALSFAIFNLVQIAVGVLIQNKLKSDNRMIMTKFVSFYSRIGMIVSLIVLHWLLANSWEISQVYNLYGWLSMTVFCLIFGCLSLKITLERKYVSKFAS